MTDHTTDHHDACTRCGCCSIEWVECEHCGGEGVDGHDCGDDCCCCLDPEDNVPCDICDSNGGWWECVGRCDTAGNHSSSRGAQE